MTKSALAPVDRRSWPATTAGAIQRLALSRRTTRDLAPLGIALHHLSDGLLSVGISSPLEVHRATTVLTKQIAAGIDAPDPLAALSDLLTDPDRIAVPDGRTASEFCGPAWTRIRDITIERNSAAAAGIDEYGIVTVFRLAALHAANTTAPWWGTAAWEKRVTAWLSDVPYAPLLRSALLRSPEFVDDEILADILR